MAAISWLSVGRWALSSRPEGVAALSDLTRWTQMSRVKGRAGRRSQSRRGFSITVKSSAARDWGTSEGTNRDGGRPPSLQPLHTNNTQLSVLTYLVKENTYRNTATTMSMFSRTGSTGTPADQNAKKMEVMAQVKQELEVARLQELINVRHRFLKLHTNGKMRAHVMFRALHWLLFPCPTSAQNMTQRCYIVCQPSGSSLSSKDQTCLSNCMGEHELPLRVKTRRLSLTLTDDSTALLPPSHRPIFRSMCVPIGVVCHVAVAGCVFQQGRTLTFDAVSFLPRSPRSRCRLADLRTTSGQGESCGWGCQSIRLADTLTTSISPAYVTPSCMPKQCSMIEKECIAHRGVILHGLDARTGRTHYKR